MHNECVVSTFPMRCSWRTVSFHAADRWLCSAQKKDARQLDLFERSSDDMFFQGVDIRSDVGQFWHGYQVVCNVSQIATGRTEAVGMRLSRIPGSYSGRLPLDEHAIATGGHAQFRPRGLHAFLSRGSGAKCGLSKEMLALTGTITFSRPFC